MKHLPKHLRPRWRYIAVKIETLPTVQLSQREIQKAIWTSARSLLGDPGSADADLRVVDSALGPGGGTVLVRVRRDAVSDSRAALTCIDTVADHPVGIHVRGISGTQDTAEEKYMNEPDTSYQEERVVFEQSTRQAVHRGDGRVDLRTEGGIIGATELDLE